jgi:hypothetical protein
MTAAAAHFAVMATALFHNRRWTNSTARVVFRNEVTFDLSAEYLLTQHRNLGVQFGGTIRMRLKVQETTPNVCFAERAVTSKHILTLQFARDFCDREFPRK